MTVPTADSAELPPPLSLDQATLALRGMREAILIQDANYTVVFANDSAAHLCGFSSAAAMLAAPLAEILPRFDLLDAAGPPFNEQREQFLSAAEADRQAVE